MENSVVALKIQKSLPNTSLPYQNFREKNIRGTGFVIDIEKGLILTNAQLVENAVSILGKISVLGKKEFGLEVLGICLEKEAAVCKITHLETFLQQLPSKNINLIFGDSMKVGIGGTTKTLGYNGDNLETVPGTVRGFNSNCSSIEDTYQRSSSYLVVNGDYKNLIGSPLLNSKKEVVGIHSFKSGNVVPSRTLLAVYKNLLNSPVLKMPTLGLEWCSTNRELMKLKTGSSSTYGIYVRKCHPDSCFDLLEKGDIIRRLDYSDIFWDRDKLDINDLESKNTVTIFFDRFGMTHLVGKLKNLDEPDPNKIAFEKIYTEQKLTLSELMDMIPVDADLSLNICRDGTWYKLKTKYSPVENRNSSLDYEIFSGICVSDLNSKHLQIYPNLDRYKKQVIITSIFSDSGVGKLGSLKEGQIIKSIIGYDSKFELVEETHRAITSLEDLRHILHLKPDFIQITTTDDFTYVTSLEAMMKEDKDILKRYSILKKYILE